MPSLFAAADAMSSAAVDFVFGEELTLLPRVQGGYTSGGGPDPDREPVTFTGTLSGALGTQDSGGDRRGGDFRGEVTTRDRQVTADIANWPSSAKLGDFIEATDLRGQKVRYEIIGEPVTDGMNRYIVPLVNAP